MRQWCCNWVIPLAVLKPDIPYGVIHDYRCNWAIPLAVLKPRVVCSRFDFDFGVATGPYRLRYWNSSLKRGFLISSYLLQQGNTACGIETRKACKQSFFEILFWSYSIYIPLAVLKQCNESNSGHHQERLLLDNPACGIEVSILHYFVMVNLLDFIGRHLLSPVSKIQIPNETLRDDHNLVSTRWTKIKMTGGTKKSSRQWMFDNCFK